MNYTPGPWNIEKGEKRINTIAWIISANDGFGPVAFSTGANKNLIAAAPDLLEALENIEANLTGTDCMPERIADSLRRAKNALAKLD